MLPPTQTASGSTPPPAPPANDASPPVEPPKRRRLSRGWKIALWVAIPLALLGSAVGAAAVVKVPYWSYAPGSIRDTAPIVQVEGAEVFPVEGSISFATVSIRGRLTALEWAIAMIDPDATVVPEVDVLGDRDENENRQINLQLMDMSTQTSSYVALERLGYDVEILGTGAIILAVVDDSPALGVLEVGDTVVEVDGQPVTVADELIATISGRSPGTQVTLGVTALGSTEVEERTVTLAAREDDPTQAFLGVFPQTRDLLYDFPVEIDFAVGSVGGPSAGLAFTLALLDALTPGELTGGLDIAATGTMDSGGNVGLIGGLEYKAVAARRQGVDIFFVPAGQPEEELALAQRMAGSSVRVVPVSTLDEVLAVLQEAGGDPLPVD
ncbi:MAG: YlbL family protein [Acidimicrobiales bacterium]